MMAGAHLTMGIVFFVCAAAAGSTEGSSKDAATDGFCEAGENCTSTAADESSVHILTLTLNHLPEVRD